MLLILTIFKDLEKFHAELDRYHDVSYASKVEIDCAKAKGDLVSYKMESEKSFNEYTQKISDLNQTISEMKKEFFAHQETISIMSQEKEAQKKFHKTREDKELKKVIALENKIKILDDIVYKTGQSVQTMNMFNHNCKTSFLKPEYLKKAQRANPRLYDIGVIPTTSFGKPQLKRNRLKDKAMHNNSEGKKQQVEDHHRKFKFYHNKISVTVCIDSINAKTSNVNFVCVTCGKCVLNDNHDMCLLHYINGVNSRTKMPIVVPVSTREPKQTVSQSVATHLKRTVAAESTNQKPRSKIRKQYEQIKKIYKWWYCKITPPGYKWKPKFRTVNDEPNLVEIILFIVDSGCSKHMMENLKLLSNFVEQFLGSYGTDLYSITLQDTSTPNLIYLIAKATSSQVWLWHRSLSHLNFDTINLLLKFDIVTGLPKLKFIKDYLCSSCKLRKAKRKSFKTKTTPSSKRRLQILHMDLYGPMRVESFYGKKYVLEQEQDSSRMTVNVEETASNAMVAIDGAGFDWCYMADDEVPTNRALMVFQTLRY
uniref:Retrovirus-related Pol polyprotein from transposon TNT 1-94 n=1 Tax=Tanacetum cinerariifolium TaxID=118510 RepID=A0A6L2MAW5_TANCI|nr:retrovirus-related Pol polyprotein from transposon TNT 1-94 [Tanacetum cinerariifolium]